MNLIDFGFVLKGEGVVFKEIATLPQSFPRSCVIAVRTGFGVFCRRSLLLKQYADVDIFALLKPAWKVVQRLSTKLQAVFLAQGWQMGKSKNPKLSSRVYSLQVPTLYVVISARYPGNPQTWQHCFSEGAICKSTVNTITNVKIELYRIFVCDGMKFSEILRFS